MVTVARPRGSGLVEREAELSRIEDALARAREGQGGVVMVAGPAGIGKSALLAATRAAAAGSSMRVLRAQGAELEGEFGFGIVRQLFEPLLVEAPEAERAEWLAGPARLAARLLGLPGANSGGDESIAESPDPSFAVLHGLYWLCANLAATRPICLVVDDAHWGDVSSLRFLSFLLPRLEELHAAVVTATRPGEGAAASELLLSIAADAGTELIQPAPLSLQALDRLVHDALGEEPDAAFVVGFHRATGGMPLLVGSLIQAVHDDGLAPTASSAAGLENLGARWAARWILVRLGRLPVEAGRLAQALAVLEVAELADAAAVCGLESESAARATDALERAGIIRRGRPLRFVHPVVRRGIYDEIGSAQRARSHREAARLLAASAAPPERVVEHLLLAEPSGDAWVVERLHDAAGGALATGAHESATSYLRRALEEPPDPQQRFEVLLKLGTAEFHAGDARAFGDLERAVDLAGTDEQRLQAGLLLTLALAVAQRFKEALAVLDRVPAGFARPELSVTGLLETMAVGVAMLDAETTAASRKRIQTARARVDVDKQATREDLALAALIAGQGNEPAHTVAELAERAWAAAGQTLPTPADWSWYDQLVVSLVWSERLDLALPRLDAVIAQARVTADTRQLASALAYRALASLQRGDLQAAEADARTVFETHGLHAPPLYRTLNAAVLVEVLVEIGELDEAERILTLVPDEAEREHSVAACLRLSRGRLRLARRQSKGGLADVLAAGAVATRMGFDSPGWLPWRPAAALGHLACGDADAARNYAHSGVELARAFGAPRTLGVALHAAAVVQGGAPGERLLHEAITAHEHAGARLEHARSLADLGAILRRGNRPVDSRQRLREALDIATRLGARPLAERAETELRATGARPRRVVLTGRESLTASERRVGELAAQGLGNREIAQTLFVTARTVEGHLTGVFRKLDLSSREELAGALCTRPN